MVKDAAIKKELKNLVERLPDVISARRRLSAHIKNYGSADNFEDDNIRFVKPL